MIKAIIILILFCIIGFGIGLCIRQYNTKSSLHKGTDIEDISLDRECEGGICPPPEEWKDK